LKYKTTRGFTLLELMMVLAITGILAAIAIPSYQAYIYRAKATEVILVLDKIKTVLSGLQVERGAQLGSDLSLKTELNQVLWAKRGDTAFAVIPELSKADLDLARLGIKLTIQSGLSGTLQPGQYQVSIRWSFPPADPALSLSSRQIALATADVMERNAYRVDRGSILANLYFNLGGSTTTSPGTASTVTSPVVVAPVISQPIVFDNNGKCVSGCPPVVVPVPSQVTVFDKNGNCVSGCPPKATGVANPGSGVVTPPTNPGTASTGTSAQPQPAAGKNPGTGAANSNPQRPTSQPLDAPQLASDLQSMREMDFLNQRDKETVGATAAQMATDTAYALVVRRVLNGSAYNRPIQIPSSAQERTTIRFSAEMRNALEAAYPEALRRLCFARNGPGYPGCG
jgi:prepilin-type N-terminal cleavage/methylation domain-containing protein